jgi:hypothetical protein
LQQILLSDIGDIDKSKKNIETEAHMEDKDYYDNNLKTDTLICRNIQAEANTAVEEIKSIYKDLKKMSEDKSGAPNKDASKHFTGRVKRVSYNLRS